MHHTCTALLLTLMIKSFSTFDTGSLRHRDKVAAMSDAAMRSVQLSPSECQYGEFAPPNFNMHEFGHRLNLVILPLS